MTAADSERTAGATYAADTRRPAPRGGPFDCAQGRLRVRPYMKPLHKIDGFPAIKNSI